MKYLNGIIVADKILNNLDRFVIDFINVFEKHSDYVIVSGYVSIILGRSRISEDVDLIFNKKSKEEFIKIHEDMLRKGFWCLNSDDIEELYSLLESKHSIRYGFNNNPFPNMEIKFAKNQIDYLALKTRIIVRLPSKDIYISDLNLQIAFKEKILASSKDIEDAMHLRKTFKEQIEEDKIKIYKELMI
ncbi:MAG: hypothetical protein ACMXYL_03550 [Candidatus Woesearchaeota archaeon]